MAYDAKKLAELLRKLPVKTEVFGWDDGNLYLYLENEQYYINEDFEVIKCYSYGEIKYEV